jgi:hypothetical protein
VGQSAQLLLEHDPVSVPARQRDPRRHTAFQKETAHDRRREVGAILVLADEHGVTRPSQHRRRGDDVRGVERIAAEVAEDQRRRHRVGLCDGTRPGHRVVEYTRGGHHLAPAVDPDPTAGPEFHSLGTTLDRRTGRHVTA